MGKYVMGNRSAGRRSEHLKSRGATLMNVALDTFQSGINIVKEYESEDPTQRGTVKFEADEADVAQMMLTLGDDVILEPEIPHYRQINSPFGFPAGHAHTADDIDVGDGKVTNLVVMGGDAPIAGAKVTLGLRGYGSTTSELVKVSNSLGRVRFTYSDYWTPIAAVAEPADGFWQTVRYGPTSGDKIHCEALPNGPLGWWHNEIGITERDLTLGENIKIGVADTGLGNNPNLGHVTDIGSFISGYDPDGGADVSSHGTHVLGLVGARPSAARDFVGVAPGADIYSARIFENEKAQAKNDDIAAAIKALARKHKVDIINLSLAAVKRSSIVADAVKWAFEQGTICVCAAGNLKTTVLYPAALPQAYAVSGVGHLGTTPPGTISATRAPDVPEKYAKDKLYLAKFSCFGEEVDCTAPGVGIISTLPDKLGNQRSYGSRDGTSMATPLVTGIAAAKLSVHPTFSDMARDEVRSQVMIQTLRESCKDIGLASKYGGTGIPQV